jgi:hypothetical protein
VASGGSPPALTGQPSSPVASGVVATSGKPVRWAARGHPEMAGHSHSTQRWSYRPRAQCFTPRGERDVRGFEQKLYRAVPGLQRLGAGPDLRWPGVLGAGFAVHPP